METEPKTIYKAYKFRLYPNQNQQLLLNQHLGCDRFIYNYFLNQRKEQYLETNASDNYYKQAKKLTCLKKESEFKWLNDVNSQSLQFSLKQIEIAYNRFFKEISGFPRFKQKKSSSSFTIPQYTKLKDNKIHIPKIKTGICVVNHREINGKISKSTITKTASNKYFISILSEEIYKPISKTNKKIGIDLGIKDFVITSEGFRFKNNRYTKKYEKRLKIAQQHLSRKDKGSSSYEKQRRKVALIHEKIVNSRKDNLHKVSHNLIKRYDIICVEDLNIKGMIKNNTLSKHIADVSWGMFIEFLKYKAEWNDKQVISIDRYFPSTKLCNNCGYINNNLDLNIRKYKCPSCNETLDRDINASKNILKEGLNKLKSVGIVDYISGDTNKTSKDINPLKHKSVKLKDTSL